MKRHQETDPKYTFGTAARSFNNVAWSLGAVCYGLIAICATLGLAFVMGSDSPSVIAGWIMLGSNIPLLFCALKFHGHL